MVGAGSFCAVRVNAHDTQPHVCVLMLARRRTAVGSKNLMAMKYGTDVFPTVKAYQMEPLRPRWDQKVRNEKQHKACPIMLLLIIQTPTVNTINILILMLIAY